MDEYRASIDQWRAARYARLTAPDGWLAVIAKTHLDGPTTVGSAESCGVRLPRGPARALTIEPRGPTARVRVEPGAEITLGHARLDERGERDITPADVLRMDAFAMQLVVRADEHAVATYLRVKDEQSAARLAFDGIPHFPVDPRWRVTARFEAFDAERTIELDYEAGGVTTYRSPGVAVFEVDGRAQRLLVMDDTDRPRAFLLFKDATNQDETYGVGRFLYAPSPADGRIVLDFNTAFNPPCAITPFASCPLVPRENRLAARIEAGEKRLAHH